MSVLRKCDEPSCRKRYEASRADSRFCSAACRQRAARKGKGRKPATVVEIGSVREPSEPTLEQIVEDGDEQPEHGPVYMAVLAELAAAGRESSVAGAAALKLAWRLDRGRVIDTGSSLASAAAKVVDLVALATRGSVVKDDPVTELRKRREERRRRGA